MKWLQYSIAIFILFQVACYNGNFDHSKTKENGEAHFSDPGDKKNQDPRFHKMVVANTKDCLKLKWSDIKAKYSEIRLQSTSNEEFLVTVALYTDEFILNNCRTQNNTILLQTINAKSSSDSTDPFSSQETR